MANDSGSGRAIGIRDWFADSRRRIQRYVPRTIASLRPMRLTSGLTLGVLMQQRGARSIQQVSPRGLAGPQQPPLVLRRVISLASPSEPILTVQSPVRPSLAPAVPPSPAADRREEIAPALEASVPLEREEAAPPSLLSRTLRRLFSQPEPAAVAIDRSPTVPSTAAESPDWSSEAEATAAQTAASQMGEPTSESDLPDLDSSFEDADLESDTEPEESETPGQASPASGTPQSSFTLVRHMLQQPEGESEDAGGASTGDATAPPSAPATGASITRQEASTSAAAPAERAEPPKQAAAAPEQSGLLLTLRRLFHRDEPAVAETADIAPAPASDPQPQPVSIGAEPASRTFEPERSSLAVEPSPRPELPTLERPPDEPSAPSGAAVSQPPSREPVGPLTLLRRLLPHHSSKGEPSPATMESPLARDGTPSPTPQPQTNLRAPQADAAPGIEAEAAVAAAETEAPPRESRSEQPLVFRSFAAEAPSATETPPSVRPVRASQAAAELNLAPWSPVYRSVPGRPSTAIEEKSLGAAPVSYGWTEPSSNGLVATRSSSPALPPFSQAASPASVAVARQNVPEPDQMPAAAPAGAAAAEPGLSAAALERLAFQVYERLRRRLITERERAGIGAQWR